MRNGKLFTKSEAVKLTDLTHHKLQYLDRIGLIKASKFGRYGQKSWWYKWNDLISLKVYFKLREHCSLQMLEKTFETLKLEIPPEGIAEKKLIAFTNKVFWIGSNPDDLFQIVAGAFKKGNQFLFSIEGNELLEEIWQMAEQKKVDIADRAKEKPRSRIVA